MHIAHHVNVTDTARSLLHKRTQTGARSTASAVARRAKQVYYWSFDVDRIKLEVVIAYFQDFIVCYSSVYDICVMITRFNLELPAS